MFASALLNYGAIKVPIYTICIDGGSFQEMRPALLVVFVDFILNFNNCFSLLFLHVFVCFRIR